MVKVNMDSDNCPCLKCIYLVHSTRVNEKEDGSFNLRINCGISGCPKGIADERPVKVPDLNAKEKISAFVKIVERCIAQEFRRRE